MAKVEVFIEFPANTKKLIIEGESFQDVVNSVLSLAPGITDSYTSGTSRWYRLVTGTMITFTDSELKIGDKVKFIGKIYTILAFGKVANRDCVKVAENVWLERGSVIRA